MSLGTSCGISGGSPTNIFRGKGGNNLNVVAKCDKLPAVKRCFDPTPTRPLDVSAQSHRSACMGFAPNGFVFFFVHVVVIGFFSLFWLL